MGDKSAYAQKLEARLDQWRAEIDSLQAKAKEAGADAELKYHDQLAELRAKQKKARESLDDLNKAQGEAWKDLKSGMEAAWDDLGKAVRKAADRFR
ncbi:coiled coil domain-containing protein [Yoonia sp.]|uniref:coiled coil domain-containing protein n=1 Tax=Yoonia sp. TaxID=2212373 RepID=UPI0025E7E6F2|nr:coiled coil domain-containing protein [Yoonia sp.]